MVKTFKAISAKASSNMGQAAQRACAILSTIFSSGGIDPEKLTEIEVDWRTVYDRGYPDGTRSDATVFPVVKIKFNDQSTRTYDGS